MFEEVMGVPAHPLLVHAAVVFVPLLALAGLAYAFVPVVRPHLRWVLGGLALVAPGAALFAKLSGDAFHARLGDKGMISVEFEPVLREHRDLGNLTLYATIALAVSTLALVYFVAPRVTTAGPTTAAAAKVLPLLLAALVAVSAVASVYYVVRTGDSGAKAVWGGF